MDLEFLTQNWQDITSRFSGPKALYLTDILRQYSHSSRYYHTLDHIQSLLQFAQSYESQLSHLQSIQFAIWYHDLVYKVHRKDNELKSAEVAKKHLTQLKVDPSVISYVYALIVATQTHTVPTNWDNFDTRFLLDIDLSILAVEKPDYLRYVQQIRKEYKIFPNPLYNAGRKKVLTHFLAREQIYHTQLFFELWENKARNNIQLELKML